MERWLIHCERGGRPPWQHVDEAGGDIFGVRPVGSCLRLHGAIEIYASGYDDDALDEWARHCRAWLAGREPRGARRIGSPAPKRPGRDGFVFFDNDAKVRAPFDAMGLADRLQLDWRERHAD